MRTPITLRLESSLLAAARAEARRDSRTLTNFVEVALKHRLGLAGQDPAASPRGHVAAAHMESIPNDKPSNADRQPGGA